MSKSLALLIAVLLLSLSLAACGGGGEEEAPSGETPGASPTGGTVTIDLWHSETASNADTLNAWPLGTTRYRKRSRCSWPSRARLQISSPK